MTMLAARNQRLMELVTTRDNLTRRIRAMTPAPEHAPTPYDEWKATPEGAAIYADLTGRLALIHPDPADVTARRQREAIS